MSFDKTRAARNLKKHLEDQTLVEFAAEIGVTIFAVRKWLSGERVPRDKTKLKISKATGDSVKVQDWVAS
jgi:hypothetical protein